MKKLVLTLSLVMFLFGVSACEKNEKTLYHNKLDYSNIDNLYEQPLKVVQKCVEGKWKLLYSSNDDWITEYTNTTINITKEIIIAEGPTDEINLFFKRAGEQTSFFYVWKKIKYYSEGDFMWTISPAVDGAAHEADLYSMSIKNDTLHFAKMCIGCGEYLLRIKEGD